MARVLKVWDYDSI